MFYFVKLQDLRIYLRKYVCNHKQMVLCFIMETYIQFVKHVLVYNVHCTTYCAHMYLPYDVYCTQYSVYIYIMYSKHIENYYIKNVHYSHDLISLFIEYTLYNVQYTIELIRSRLRIVHCTLYSVHCTLYAVLYDMYVWHTSYALYCTLYNVHDLYWITHKVEQMRYHYVMQTW